MSTASKRAARSRHRRSSPPRSGSAGRATGSSRRSPRLHPAPLSHRGVMEPDAVNEHPGIAAPYRRKGGRRARRAQQREVADAPRQYLCKGRDGSGVPALMLLVQPGRLGSPTGGASLHAKRPGSGGSGRRVHTVFDRRRGWGRHVRARSRRVWLSSAKVQKGPPRQRPGSLTLIPLGRSRCEDDA